MRTSDEYFIYYIFIHSINMYIVVFLWLWPSLSEAQRQKLCKKGAVSVLMELNVLTVDSSLWKQEPSERHVVLPRKPHGLMRQGVTVPVLIRLSSNIIVCGDLEQFLKLAAFGEELESDCRWISLKTDEKHC